MAVHFEARRFRYGRTYRWGKTHIAKQDSEGNEVVGWRRTARLAMVAALAVLVGVLPGCGGSGGDGLSLQDIPRYPNAVEGESMGQSSPGGMLSGSLSQFTTADSFDQVVGFYTDALGQYDPELMSHTSELGRQTAISMPQRNGMVSVVIQEFTEEGTVSITFMAVGG
jgi:hypothetical protein